MITPILRELTEDSLRRLASKSLCRTYGFPADIDWRSGGGGELEECVLCVVEGSVRVSLLSVEGKELPLFLVQAGQVLHLDRDGVGGLDETILTAALPSVLVCRIPYGEFEAAVAASPSAARLLIGEQHRQVRELAAVANDRLHAPRARIRHALWRGARESDDWSAYYTHEQLASWAGAERATTTREIGTLRDRHVVRVDKRKHRIQVLDPEELIGEQD
jgi:CRP-like cAMP-binding protein